MEVRSLVSNQYHQDNWTASLALSELANDTLFRHLIFPSSSDGYGYTYGSFMAMAMVRVMVMFTVPEWRRGFGM